MTFWSWRNGGGVHIKSLKAYFPFPAIMQGLPLKHRRNSLPSSLRCDLNDGPLRAATMWSLSRVLSGSPRKSKRKGITWRLWIPIYHINSLQAVTFQTNNSKGTSPWRKGCKELNVTVTWVSFIHGGVWSMHLSISSLYQKTLLENASLLAMLCTHRTFHPDNLGCLRGAWLVFLSHRDSLRNSKCQLCSVSIDDNLFR